MAKKDKEGPIEGLCQWRKKEREKKRPYYSQRNTLQYQITYNYPNIHEKVTLTIRDPFWSTLGGALTEEKKEPREKNKSVGSKNRRDKRPR